MDRRRFLPTVGQLAAMAGEKEPEYSYKHDLAVQEAVLKASGAPLNS